MPAANWTDQQILTQLNSAFSWTGSTITYRFATSAVGLTGATESSAFTAFNASQVTAATVALGLWDDLIAPSLVATTATTSNIEFGNTTAGVSYAQGYLPSGGTVWFNPTYAELATPVIGKHGFLTMVHELGHAFGLNHMGSYNGAGPATPSSFQDSTVFSIMSYFGPSWGTGPTSGIGLVAWADWVGADNILYSPQTPMLNDIMAIQAKYGADLSTRTGNTVYGFNSTVGAASGGIYDFTRNLHAIISIYDAAGIDTLDLSGWSTDSSISLVPGTFSSGNSMTNNISIAYTAVIENAVGGAGADTIVGNAYNNTLNGGSGNDTLTGGMGNDTIIGGLGTDTAVFTGAISTYTVSYNAATQTFTLVSAAEGTDTITGVESFQFSDILKTAASLIPPPTTAVSIAATTASANEGNTGTTAFIFTVTLAAAATATQSVNYVVAGTGANAADAADFASALTGTVTFAAGEISKIVTVNVAGDTLFEQNETFSVTLSGVSAGLALGTSSASATILNDDAFVNLVNGTATNDNLYGTAGIDQMYGLAGADLLAGNDGNDYLDGGAGDDVLVGGGGADTIIGGGGVDLASYETSSSGVTVDLRLTTAQISGGDASGDILSGITNLRGSAFDDLLSGDANANFIDGSVGGVDTVTYARSTAGVTVDLQLLGPQVSGGDASGDTLFHISNIIGSVFSDTLSGNSNYNILTGGGGNDTVSYAKSAQGVTVDLNLTAAQSSLGDAMSDRLIGISNIIGSSHNDYLLGNASNNVLEGGGGSDTIIGGGGSDTVSCASAATGVGILLATVSQTQGYIWDGTSQSNIYNISNAIGSSHNDYLLGNASNNVLEGGGGSDTIIGGGGSDTVSCASAATGVGILLATVSQTQGYIWDGTSQSNIYNISNAIGSSHNDYLTGNDSANFIEAGLGNDIMYGGLGADSFVFDTLSFGADTISDFQDGIDHLSFSSALATSLANFTITDNDTASVTVTLNGGGSIVIVGMSGITHVDAGDFLFM
jgi:serralysin